MNYFQYVDQSDGNELARYIRIKGRPLINMIIVVCVIFRKKAAHSVEH